MPDLAQVKESGSDPTSGVSSTSARGYLRTIVKYAIGLSLLGFVLWLNWDPSDQPGLRDILQKPIRFGPLALGWAFVGTALMLTFLRWYLLVRTQGLQLTLPEAFRLGMIGHCLSTLQPGVVGGDVVKAAFLAKGTNRKAVAVATVIVDRFLGVCGLFWLTGIIGAIFGISGIVSIESNAVRWVLAIAWSIIAGSVLGWLLVLLFPKQWAEPISERFRRLPKIGSALAELWQALWLYRLRGGVVLAALGLAITSQSCLVFGFYWAARTIGTLELLPSLETHFFVVPMGLTIQAMVITPGGIGGGELAFGYFYDEFGGASSMGVLAALMFRFVIYSQAALGFFVGFRNTNRISPTSVEQPAEAPVGRTEAPLANESESLNNSESVAVS